MCNVYEENSTHSLTLSQDDAPPDVMSDPLRVNWPKDRVLINRIDKLCSLVLNGHWPSGRRDTLESQYSLACDKQGPADNFGYSRVFRKGNDVLPGQNTEFTVKLLKEEGLKLTFSKQSNGSAGETSGRQGHKEKESTGTDAMPYAARKRDLPSWLKESPDYEVEGDMLEMLVNRTKRKRRKKKADKEGGLTGNEKVKIIDLRTGKKCDGEHAPALQDLKNYLTENPHHAVAPDWADTVRNSGLLPEHFFHRLLTRHSSERKKSHHTTITQSDPLLGGDEREMLISDGPFIMDHEDLNSDLTCRHFLTYDTKPEDGSSDMDKGDGLSQVVYDGSSREAFLDDIIMSPKNSDSSSNLQY